MPATAEALIHQILDPALPVTGAPSAPPPALERETASVLIGRILNPEARPAGRHPARDR